MSEVNTRPACYLAIHHTPPLPPAHSLPITAFLETTLSFAIGSQQADTCLGDGSTVNWLDAALNTLACQTHQSPDSPGRQP